MSSVQPTFLFDNQKRFDAQCEHDRSRSLLLSDIEAPPNTDPWKQRPVDFTMKNFHPKRKKDGKQSLQQNESPRERRSQSTENFDPRVMEPFLNQYKNANDPSSIGNDDDEDFDLDTRIQYERVKRMLNTEPYKNPKPHDYRQVSFDVENFSTRRKVNKFLCFLVQLLLFLVSGSKRVGFTRIFG